MLLTYLAQMGETLNKAKSGCLLGWNDSIWISYEIVIDLQGQIRGAIHHQQPLQKNYPVWLYDENYSNYCKRLDSHPHMLCLRVRAIGNDVVWGTFVDNLIAVNAVVDNESLTAIQKCVTRQTCREELKKLGLENPKGYVTFALIVKDKPECILDNPSVQKDTSEYINMLITKDGYPANTCDILGGWQRIIPKHSQVFRGGQLPRLSTTNCYDDYYGLNSETSVLNEIVRIGAHTELLIMKALDCIYSQSPSPSEETVCLFDFGLARFFPIAVNAKRLARCDKDEEMTSSEWQIYQAQILEEWKSPDLLYLSFWPYSDGRISAGRIKRFTKPESKAFISNVLEWLDLTMIFNDGQLIYSLPSVDYMIDMIIGRPRRGEEINNRFRRNELLYLFVASIYKEDFRRLIDRILIPYTQSLPNDKYNAVRHLMTVIVRVARRIKMKITETIDYKVGKMLALAHQTERMGDYFAGIKNEGLSTVEGSILRFAQSPEMYFRKIRISIEPYLQTQPIKALGLYEQYIRTEVEATAIDWGEYAFDTANILVGYDSQNAEWMDYLKRRKVEKQEEDEND